MSSFTVWKPRTLHMCRSFLSNKDMIVKSYNALILHSVGINEVYTSYVDVTKVGIYNI